MLDLERRDQGPELAPDNLHPFSRMIYHTNRARLLRAEADAALAAQDLATYFDKRVELHHQEALRSQAEQQVELLAPKAQANLYEELLQRLTGGQYPHQPIPPKSEGEQEVTHPPTEQTMQPAEWDTAYAADVARYEQKLDELRQSQEFQMAQIAEQLGRLAV